VSSNTIPNTYTKQLGNEKANHATSVSRLESDILEKDKDLLARAAEIGALKGKLKAESAELDKERKAKVELQTEVKVLTTSLNTERATAKSPTDPGKGTGQAQTDEECCCSLPGQL
jgi:hypothetical protein